MSRKFWLLLLTAVALGALMFLAGCTDEDDDDNGNTPSISITSPAAGDTWVAGTVHNITWTDVNVSAVDIGYTTDGTTWHGLAQNLTASSYAWTVPNTPSTTCRIGIRSSADTLVSNISGVFTIGWPPASLVGTWDARVADLPQLGMDEMSYSLTAANTYTFYQRAGTTEINESGTWTTATDSLLFHALLRDGETIDEQIHNWYSLPANNGDTLRVRYDYDQVYTVAFIRD